jgi:hypothetical protein
VGDDKVLSQADRAIALDLSSQLVDGIQAGAAGPRSMACGAQDCQKNELSFLVIEVSINSTSVMGQKWK